MSNRQDLSRSPRPAGAVWALYFVVAMPLAWRSSLIMPGDPAATASAILAHATLFRASLATDLVSYGLYMVFTYLLYCLLAPIDRHQAAVGTLFTLAGCAVLIAATPILTLPLSLLDTTQPQVMALAERQELALTAVRTYGQFYTVGLLMFGLQWLTLGPLFARSALVPRSLGWLLTIAGLLWAAMAVMALAFPGSGTALKAVAMRVGGLAELALALWLLFNRGGRMSGGRLAAPEQAVR